MGDETRLAAQLYLQYGVVPLWIAVGFADWLCHRAARIELTAGPKESIMHVTMLAEAAVPLLMALFFEINALVLMIGAGAWLLHEATSYWDLRVAHAHREIKPIEQRVHDYLVGIPFLALSLIGIMEWPQVLALIGLGSDVADFSLTLKHEPLDGSYILAVLGAVLAFNAIPYGEELYRGLRQSGSYRAMAS
jgi:hypothetical protein